MARLRGDDRETTVVERAPDRDETMARVEGAKVRPANWMDVFDLLRRLENHGADYVLVGGYAINFNGLIRYTGDVDILVANSPENNRRWIAALSELPDGAAMALIPEANDPFPRDDENDDEPGVIRVADVYLVDVMPKACGLTIDDIRQHIRRVAHDDFHLNVVDLYGLRLLKQGVRGKDILDLQAIESALRALKNSVTEHVEEMSRRKFVAEEAPKEKITFRPSADLSKSERNALLEEIARRAKNDNDASGLNLDDLNIYCDDSALFAISRHAAPLSDLRAILGEHGVRIPEP